MSDYAYIEEDDFLENPAPRLPICLCLDFSSSMNSLTSKDGNYNVVGEPKLVDGKMVQKVEGEGLTTRKEALLKAVNEFREAIKQEPQAVCSVELSVVTFNDQVKSLSPFVNVFNMDSIKYPKAVGKTHMYTGIQVALDMIEARKHEYQDNGIDHYQPWIVLITDGVPCGEDPKEISYALARLKNKVEHKKVSLISICVKDDDRALRKLAELVNGIPPIQIKSTDFSTWFRFLSQSAVQVSSSAYIEVSDEEPSIAKQVIELAAEEGNVEGKTIIMDENNNAHTFSMASIQSEKKSWDSIVK